MPYLLYFLLFVLGVFDLSGSAGETVAAVGSTNTPDMANGRDGGSLCLHIHNLDLLSDPANDKKYSYWKGVLDFKVDGGAPGKYHRDEETSEWVSGQPGKAGMSSTLPLTCVH